MDECGWKYYNHAAIPTCAPHEEPDITPIEDGSIWKMAGRPLMARWTTDFDCGYETNWWYMVREAPFDPETLPARSRKHIRQALKKCSVKRICVEEYMDALYDCYHLAFLRYENADNEVSREVFKRECIADEQSGCEYWAGFSAESGVLIGYMKVRPYEEYTELLTTKLIPEFMNLRVSDALYCTVLSHYLNEAGKRYVTSGSRNINHKTNTEEYKIQSFGYKRAYCRLHMKYQPAVKLAVDCLFPFRKLLRRFDGNTTVHQVNAVLRMEEICREAKGEK